MLVDISKIWTSIAYNCQLKLETCLIKSKDCIDPYFQSFISINGNKINGKQNIIEGWNENVCLECKDVKGDIH